jgi:hypothetical protein
VWQWGGDISKHKPNFKCTSTSTQSSASANANTKPQSPASGSLYKKSTCNRTQVSQDQAHKRHASNHIEEKLTRATEINALRFQPAPAHTTTGSQQ